MTARPNTFVRFLLSVCVAGLVLLPPTKVAARGNPDSNPIWNVLLGALWNSQATLVPIADGVYGDHAATVVVKDGIWYRFSVLYMSGSLPSGCAAQLKLIVRSSSNHGQSWSSAEDVAVPDEGSGSLKCEVVDADAYYDDDAGKWHILAQCRGENDGGAGDDFYHMCHYFRNDSSPMGAFTPNSYNPVVDGNDLFSTICDQFCSSSTWDEGTPDIVYKDGDDFYVSFHGVTSVGPVTLVRGVAKTQDFVTWDTSVLSDAMYGPSDCQMWVSGCLGGGAATSIVSDRWNYTIIEYQTSDQGIGVGCGTANTLGFGLIRAEGTFVTSGEWESYPGNPLLPAPAQTTTTAVCAPAYPRWFTEGDHVYLSVQGRDGNNEGHQYFFELVLNSNVGNGILFPGATLGNDTSLVSQDSSFYLNYGSDGILRQLRSGDSIPLWDRVESYGNAGYLEMATNGNLVIYNGSSQAVWSSGTGGHAGAYLVVQNDGNLVIYESGGEPIWCTSTGILNNDHLMSDHSLYVNDYISTSDDQYRLTYQGDGNLVLSHGSTAVWSAGVSTGSPGRARIDRDGNLALYDSSEGTYGFSSGTSGHRNAFLQIEPGQIVIYSSNDWPHTALWVRPTSTQSPTANWLGDLLVAPYRSSASRVKGSNSGGLRTIRHPQVSPRLY